MVPFYLQYIANGKVQTPVEKYVMAKLIELAGDKYFFEGSEKSIAKKVEVADKTVSKLLDHWVSEGVLDKGPAGLQKGRGRPGSKYGLRPNKMRFKAATHPSRVEGLFSALVDNLAGLDRGKKYAGGDHKLTYSPRVLLMVLLSHADNCGVVRHLGYADLAERTGLSRRGVMNHLEKLKREGYIRAFVPGLTNSALFGKTKSIYFLNLNHKAYGELRQPGLITICHVLEPAGNDLNAESSERPRAGDVRESSAVEQVLTRWGERRLGYNYEFKLQGNPEKLDHYFQDQGIERYLHSKLDEYVLWILARNWLSPTSMRFDPKLIAFIRSELVPLKDRILVSKKVEGCDPVDKLSEDIDFLVSTIAMASSQIANLMTGILNAQETKYFSMKHALLPLSGDRGQKAGFTLVSYPKPSDPHFSPGVSILKPVRGREFKSTHLKAEDSLDQIDLQDYGLRCVSNPKARTWMSSKFAKKKESEKAK